jgi:hypothetical protein
MKTRHALISCFQVKIHPLASTVFYPSFDHSQLSIAPPIMLLPQRAVRRFKLRYQPFEVPFVLSVAVFTAVSLFTCKKDRLRCCHLFFSLIALFIPREALSR